MRAERAQRKLELLGRAVRARNPSRGARDSDTRRPTPDASRSPIRKDTRSEAGVGSRETGVECLPEKAVYALETVARFVRFAFT